jgi:hypothetical protein
VKPQNVSDHEPYRARYGMPQQYGACHTAVVEGYVIEGHVHAREIKRLLTERPKARGIAVPGMPGGSPGMEGNRGEPYDVLLVLPDGSYRVYARYRR